MAIARGAGTEIIRSAMFEDIDGSAYTPLIVGVQHHIYTVLSIMIHAETIATTGNLAEVVLLGYDAKGGTTARTVRLFKEIVPLGSTFVWNDKFSFNGAEPANFTGPMDDTTKQDAIADQGSTPVSQILKVAGSQAGDKFNVTITYIDQNNA